MNLSKRWVFFTVGISLLVLLFTGCSSAKQQDEHSDPIALTVSAAISLTDALEEIKHTYEQDHNVDITFNLAGSGTLAQQLKHGAPVDMFISANEQWMDMLGQEERIMENTKTAITGNNLVLITNKDTAISIESFMELPTSHFEQLAIGNPDSVPAGRYTKDTLQSLDLWDPLQDDVVLAKDVRQVLTYVESGNADLGFIYESDAIQSSQVEILATAESDNHHDPIVYPGAIVSDTENKKEAKAFLEFLVTDEAQQIFATYGFNK